MAGAATEGWRRLAADWAKRRHGVDAHAVTLGRHRIYILPTRFGIALAGLIVAMLLGSLNYGANLGFILTFLLAGQWLVIMRHCRNNLLTTTVRFAGAAPVFAGQDAEFRLSLRNDTDLPHFDLSIEAGDARDGPVDLPGGAGAVLRLNLAAAERGWRELPRFAVSTSHPGNLFRAWTWINMEARCLVYPAPAAPGRPAPTAFETAEGPATSHREDDDFAGLRDATPGDPPRRIAWKAFARSDQLLVKEFAGGAELPCLFDWNELGDLDDEARLSQLTRWCLDAAAAGQSFGLRLPQQTLALGRGERHLHACLEALALFGLDS